jgi:hypothetical protein
MADIGEFAEQVAADCVERQKTADARFKLGLDGEAVEELVKAAFYASLIPDEGRYYSVCLMCYPKGSDRQIHFLFRPAIETSPQEIAKLAHAVSAKSHLCCLCDQGKVVIGGIHVTTLDEMKEFGYDAGRPGNPLKLIIRGPGHIEASTGGIVSIYKGGVISEECLLRHSNAMGRMTAVMDQELRDLSNGLVESLDAVFNNITRQIVELGHGGMIIVAKEPKKSQFASFKEIDCLLLQQLLLKYWRDVIVLNQAHGGVVHAAASVNRSRSNPHFLAVASDVGMLENCVDSIAHLAGMDGAIVMDYACKVVAFNAITAKTLNESIRCELQDVHGRTLQFEDVVKNKGSRHQSGLTYAMRTPDSFVFVISQDGTITAFHNLGDGKVVCEKGLRVMDW